jgi:outer membrane biosynthesis protein TonB
MSAILGIAIAASPLLAGQEPAPPEEKRRQEEPKKQTPPNREQEPQQQEKPKPKPEKPQQEPAAPPKQQKPEEKQQQQQEREKQKQAADEEKKAKEKKQQQGQKEQQNSRTQPSPQASHGKGQRIPPEKFQSNFGSQHHFRVQHLQDGRRFQRGSYWFEIAEVWPVGWSYEDDCFIEQDGDDYYLVDVYHPDVRLMVIVVEG